MYYRNYKIIIFTVLKNKFFKKQKEKRFFEIFNFSKIILKIIFNFHGMSYKQIFVENTFKYEVNWLSRT